MKDWRDVYFSHFSLFPVLASDAQEPKALPLPDETLQSDISSFGTSG